MIKSRSAIENSLSSTLDFADMGDIINEIIKDPDADLGYEYCPVVDESKFEAKDEDFYNFDSLRQSSESDSEKSVPGFLKGKYLKSI